MGCSKMSRNGRCGARYGHTWCNNSYCSRWNWCGTSALHKRTKQAAYSKGNMKCCMKYFKPKPVKCRKGFKRVGKRCVRYHVKPVRCPKGFKRVGRKCVRIHIKPVKCR